MIISLIAAIGPRGELGFENKLLWHLPEDLKNFKKHTTGKMVVMGRKTFESIGKALPNRANVVLTRDENFKADNVIVARDFMEVFDLGLEAESDLQNELGEESFEVMIIGGGEIYAQFLPYAQYIYLSEVSYEGPCDTYFPQLDLKEWEIENQESFAGFNFKLLSRI